MGINNKHSVKWSDCWGMWSGHKILYKSISHWQGRRARHPAALQICSAVLAPAHAPPSAVPASSITCLYNCANPSAEVPATYPLSSAVYNPIVWTLSLEWLRQTELSLYLLYKPTHDKWNTNNDTKSITHPQFRMVKMNWGEKWKRRENL